MASLRDLFGRGSVAEQLLVWGVLQGVINALLAPEFTELTQLVNEHQSLLALSPADAADAVVRGFLAQGDAAGEAAKGGIDPQRFATLVRLAGDSLPPAAAVEALRRGIIPFDSGSPDEPGFVQAIQQGRLADKWIPVMRALEVQLPSWSEALNAELEGQLDHATALHWYTVAGGDPDAYQWLFDTRGTSPTPDMLGTMANRGIIPWDGTGPAETTFEQGFLEGPWRNKWEPAMRALMEYLPPPRTVTAMLRAGSLTEQQALTLFEKEGLNPQLAQAYVNDATRAKSATVKELTRTDIANLYENHLISKADADSLLVKLGYQQTEADLITTLADTKRAASQLNSAVTKIRTQYLARKIDAAQAKAALTALHMDADQIAGLQATWAVEMDAELARLTPAQIASAYEYDILTQAEAQTELQHLGYSPLDAWTILSIKAKQPLPGKP